MLIVWNVVIVANAGINVAEVAVAKDDLDGGDIGYAAIVAATGVGLTIGSLLISIVLGSVGLRRAYVSSIVLMSLGWALAAGAPTIWLAAIAAAWHDRQRGRDRLQPAADPARGTRQPARSRDCGADERDLRDVGGRHGDCRRAVNVAGGRAVWAASAVVYGIGAIAAFVMTRSCARRRIARRGCRARMSTRASRREDMVARLESGVDPAGAYKLAVRMRRVWDHDGS